MKGATALAQPHPPCHAVVLVKCISAFLKVVLGGLLFVAFPTRNTKEKVSDSNSMASNTLIHIASQQSVPQVPANIQLGHGQRGRTASFTARAV